MKYNIQIILLAIALTFTACKKDKNQIDNIINIQYLITEGTTESGITVRLESNKKNLSTGYNTIYIVLKDAHGNSLKDKEITLTPMMDMGMMQHSSPVEQPIYNPSTNAYQGAVVFTMPSGDMGSWNMTISFDTEDVVLDINIQESKLKETGSYSGNDGNKYFITLLPHQPWTVGMNDFQILVNRNESKFPTEDDFTITVNPQMLSMGHGSPNNAHPVSIGNGKYQGRVNFTMTGDWRLYFNLSKDGELIIEEAYIDILF